MPKQPVQDPTDVDDFRAMTKQARKGKKPEAPKPEPLAPEPI
jgi:hypothetical protein